MARVLALYFFSRTSNGLSTRPITFPASNDLSTRPFRFHGQRAPLRVRAPRVILVLVRRVKGLEVMDAVRTRWVQWYIEDILINI